MGFGQTAHDGKSQSRSRVRHDGIVTALTETFEHLFVFLGCDADAGVPDPEGERTVMEKSDEGRHMSGGRRELDRIGKEVDENLSKRALIAADEWARTRCLDAENDAASLRLRVEHRDRIIDQPSKVDVDFSEHELTGLDLRQIENIVDERQQMTARPIDVPGIFGILIGYARTHRLGVDDLGKTQDGVQWR